jgi:nitroimidazol reductase NimA-like FMN-containing flavoprotein (pyridoxamine 5'-phosphate oxidase superfamily)
MKDPREARTPEVERLSTAECWEYLQQAEFGRLAVIHVDGAPDIFPVNHLAHEGSLFVRTARDAKLMHIAHHPLVAYEVDGMTEDVRWSVVVRGRADRVVRDDEIRDSGIRELVSASPTAKLFAMKITASTVTGRRFSRAAAHADRLVAFEEDAAAPADPKQRPRARGERPDPIPHFGPSTGTIAVPPADEPPR